MATLNDPGTGKSWLDGLDLDPRTEHYLTRGASWHRLSREDFAQACILRYVDDVLSAEPAFIARAVRRYVDETLAATPTRQRYSICRDPQPRRLPSQGCRQLT
jgi:hypothetical protein